MSSRLQDRTDSFKQQLLTAQRRHLIGHFETTISGYEEQIDRQQKLLDVILQPEIKVRGAAVFPADVQQLSVIKEELLPEQQERSYSQFQDLKDLFKQQLLTAPREDLIGHFETTISRYQKEIDRRQKLLDVLLQPEIKLRRAVVPADVLQLLVIKKEVPSEQQEWSPSLDQEDPKPPHIKEEQEEVWTTTFPFTPVPVKTEDDDEEKPQSSQLHQRQTEQIEAEAGGEDCGGPEPARNSHPNRHLQFSGDEKTSDSSETDVSDGDWEENRETQSLKLHRPQTEQMETEADGEDCGGPEPARNLDPGTHLRPDAEDKTEDHLKLEIHVNNDDVNTRKAHLGLNFLNNDEYNSSEKLFSCSVCGKQFHRTTHLKIHMRTHTGEKPFSCSVCGKRFAQKAHLENHSRSHTGEKPFSCSFCNKRFTRSYILVSHMRTHTGEKPFSCNVCRRSFTWRHLVKRHKCGGESTRQTEQMETEADGENCGGPEPARNSHPDTYLTPDTDDSVDSDFWKETRQHQSGFTYQRNKTVSVNDRCNTGKEPVSCSDDVAKTEPRTDDKQSRQHKSDANHLKHDSKSAFSPCERHTASEDTHNLCHTGEKPFRCFFCGKRFATGGHLTRHITVHVGESCVVCEKKFTLESEFMSHECVSESSQLHTANKSFSCSHCGKRFEHKHHLQVHMRTHAGEKPFSCSVCSKTFIRREILSLHMTCHTAEKPLHCTVCNTGFIDSESLIEHMRIHTSQTQFSCSICGKEFAWRRYLTKHMEIHGKEELYRCSVCDKGFTQRYQLSYHRCVGRPSSQLHQSQTKESRKPEDCGGLEPARSSAPDRHLQFSGDEKTSDSSETDVSDGDWEENRETQSLKLHRPQTEQTETEADGEDCGGPEPARNSDPGTHLTPDAEDKTEDHLKLEIQVNNDDENTREACLGSKFLNKARYNSCEKLFSCSVCGKQFHKKSNLWTHMRTHTGEKPYSCSVCGKRFSQKANLKIHFRNHTGEKPYSCSICGKTFAQKAHLKVHFRCHTGEKPFSCSFCNKCFSRPFILMSHMRTHTGEKPFSCSVCHKSFSWSHLVKRHKCGGESTRQTEQMETEADGEDCGGPEPARNSHPDTHLTPDTDDSVDSDL